MCSLTWPDKMARERLDQVVFETLYAPFNIAQYDDSKPIVDFVGRKGELHNLKDQIQKVVQGGKSRAVQLSGPSGVGKSTLFNYLKDSIENERVAQGKLLAAPNYLSSDIDIFSSYFPMPNQIFDFAEIWEPMLKGLQHGFEKEIGTDVTLPEYIIFHFVFQMLRLDPDGISRIIWKTAPSPSDLSSVKLKDIIRPLQTRGKGAVVDLQEYFTLHKQAIREKLVVTINNVTYKISRTDNDTILNLFRVLDEDDPENYLDRIVKRNNPLYVENEKLITFFNDLMRFYTCLTGKKPILLVGIDEAGKAENEGQEDVYLHLGHVFLTLRNSLDYVLFVFISTDDDWATFNKVMEKNKALSGQISEFMFIQALKQLEVDQVTQVFRNRMNYFWEQHASDRSPVAPYYPFSDNLFEYVFRNEKRDLRKAIHFLHKLWSSFRLNHQVPKLESMFESMRIVWVHMERSFDLAALQPFEWNIIRKAFNEPQRYQNNALRSSSIEKGLERAWKVLEQEPASAMKVSRIPRIKMKSGATRIPDVLIELNKNLGAEHRRAVEFQVKAYKPDSSVELKHIQSSLELFEEQYTDFIYFIITGKGLTPEAEARVKALEVTNFSRIRRPSTSEIQENCLYLLALFKEITNADLQSLEGREQVVRQILHTILGRPVEEFLKEVKSLAFRPPKVEVMEELLPEPGDDDSGDGGDGTPPEPPPQPIPESPLWKKYPDLKPYRYELCALCSYLRGRESGTNKFKFVEATVQKNTVAKDASLTKELLTRLVKELFKQGYTISVSSTSFKLTPKGETLYGEVKTNNFQC